MAPRSAFFVVLIWGVVEAADAAQVAHDRNPWPKQALRRRSIPVEDHNTSPDASMLSALAPTASSDGRAGDSRQVENLLRLASGAERLDPEAFDDLFEQLRAGQRGTLNASLQGTENDYNGHVADVAACETNHGFHGAPANARRIAYDAAVQAYNAEVDYAEQKCSAQSTNCKAQETKAVSLHNYVQTEIVDAYGCHNPNVQCPPTSFNPTDFYLKDFNQVAATLKEKQGSWETAAEVCSASSGECGHANQTLNLKCEDVNGAAVSGRNDYDQCHGEHQGILNGFDTDARVAHAKTQVLNLEKVLCIVKVAVDSHGDTPKRDSVMTCTDLGAGLGPTGGVIQFKCVCTSQSSEKYSETYVAQLTLDPVPSRDTAWDPLGCTGSMISTTDTTTSQA